MMIASELLNEKILPRALAKTFGAAFHLPRAIHLPVGENTDIC
jgi:hypothetical protein